MRGGTQRTLRWKLMGWSILIFLPLLLMLVSLTYLSVHSEISKREESLLASADTFAAMVDRELNGIITTLQALSVSSSAEEGPSPSLYEDLMKLQRWQKVDYIMRDLQGLTVLTTRLPYGNSIPTNGMFQTIDRQARETGKAQVSDTFLGLVSKAPAVQIIFPINNSPQSLIIGASLDDQYFSNLLQKIPRPPDSDVGLLDKRGTFIASQPYLQGESTVWKGKADGRGIYHGEGLRGYTITAAYSKSELSGWTIVLTLPKAALLGAVFERLYFETAFLFITVFATVFAAWFVGQQSRTAANILLTASRKLQNGEKVDGLSTGIREFDEVLDALEIASNDLTKHEQTNREMLAELSHRAKNLLAVILGMVKQAAKTSTSTTSFISDFSERIQSLSRSHDLLMKSNWKPIELHDLIFAQVLTMIGSNTNQISIEGQNLLLKSSAAQSLGIALHELTTNSIKHGALKNIDGCVSISWLVERNVFLLRWTEKSQNQYIAPKRRGFGSVVLLRITPSGLGGSSTEKYLKNGYEWRVEAPIENLTASANDE